MNAREAMRRLRLGYIAEDSLEVIQMALDLAAKALKTVEWHTWEDGKYCIWCGVGKHLGHYSDCSRQLALFAIGESVNEEDYGN